MLEHSDTNTVLKAYRYTSYPDEKIASLVAQLCIENVAMAFAGIFSRSQITEAIGDANNPNDVSRAVRRQLKYK